jgi:predicted GIY-YIG superfamily endonuclease
MADEKTKTTNFSNDGIEKIPINKPIVYEILDKNNENIYTGVAKRGRGQERLKEHLSGGQDPIPEGLKVRIMQKKTISEAEKSEKIIISRSKPKHNKQYKLK